ncbi:MAG: hypothetical protein LBI67_09230 [Treponema sp.]|jgi:hypothetical protein|nr:hypothetical protein [Treponema sp.]
MKRLCIVFLFIVIQGAWAADENGFSWSLGLVSTSQAIEGSLARPIRMNDGDIFKIVILSKAPCYCYVVVQDSEKNIIILYTGTLGEDDVLTLGPIQVTPPPGLEYFYICMSAEPQPDLKNSIDAFGRNQKSSKAAQDVMDSVFGIRRSITALKENPERPVLMGGTFRGMDEKANSVEYSGVGVYVKTITIRH